MAEQRLVPLRRSRGAGERMVEAASELEELTARLRCGDGAGAGVCRFAGAIAWRLLVVREMVRASPVQARLAAGRIGTVERALAAAELVAPWGSSPDLDEAVSDLRTLLGDVADAVSAVDGESRTAI